MESNPILKFKKLPDAEVVKQINDLAIDAQWDFTNAKSPKGQRDAGERLNLYGSALELLNGKTENVKDQITKVFLEAMLAEPDFEVQEKPVRKTFQEAMDEKMRGDEKHAQ